MSEHLTIGELARRTGVTTTTLRYYDELGLVRSTGRVSGHRRYPSKAVTEVGVVRFLQEVGFTLAEAKQLITSRKRSPVRWRELAARKSEELRARIAKDSAAHEAIEHALACPEDDLLACPNLWATVNGFLAGVDLPDAHAGVHATDDG